MKQAKVAAVVDKFKVVINVGISDGVAVDDDFVLYRQGSEIVDPDTGESLGIFEEVIGRGVVTHVQEKMATLVSSETNEGGRKTIRKASRNSFNYLSSFFTPDTEEVVDLPDEVKPFLNTEVGDFAKRL